MLPSYFRNKFMIYIVQNYCKYIIIRSAFRMPTSRSYPRHLVQFCEKEKKRKSILPPFVKQGFPRVTKGYQGLPRVTKGYQRLRKVTQVTTAFRFD